MTSNYKGYNGHELNHLASDKFPYNTINFGETRFPHKYTLGETSWTLKMLPSKNTKKNSFCKNACIVVESIFVHFVEVYLGDPLTANSQRTCI